jgi:DNA polymerase-1
VHQALGWGRPACTLDPYIEFRHLLNDGAIKAEDRDKGFYSLAGALRYFCEDGIDSTHKEMMRDRILAGPPFSADEREQIMRYCEDDVRALMRLVYHIVPTIRSLPHAMARANFCWLAAQQERRGVPIDLARFNSVRSRWSEIRRDLVLEKDRDYDCYEFDAKGEPHWREHKFKQYLRRNHMDWVLRDDGEPDQREETFREMGGRYPQIEVLRELRYSMSKLRLNDLAIGADSRNRTPLWPYGTKTARNAPSTSKFIFGPAKWLRFMIGPPPGRALIHRDYAQQEVRIAAILSGDTDLLAVCEAGDVYLGIAAELGFIRESMSPIELENVRALFKVVVLSILYGVGPKALALRTGVSLYEACEILARLRARFWRVTEYSRRVLDRAGLDLEIGTQFGWYLQCPSGVKPLSVANFPIQSSAAEVLHVACALAERRGIAICAPIHDALMAEGPVADAEDISIALDQVMRDAAAVVLCGYALPSDQRIIRPGEHYADKRGLSMWQTVSRLLAKLQEQRA